MVGIGRYPSRVATNKEIVKAINSDSVASEDLVAGTLGSGSARSAGATSRRSTKKGGRRSALDADICCAGETRASSEFSVVARGRLNREPRTLMPPVGRCCQFGPGTAIASRSMG